MVKDISLEEFIPMWEEYLRGTSSNSEDDIVDLADRVDHPDVANFIDYATYCEGVRFDCFERAGNKVPQLFDLYKKYRSNGVYKEYLS